MSNQCIVEVRRFNDDVLVLVEDNYGKTFLLFEPEHFETTYPDHVSLLARVAEVSEMDGTFLVDEDGKVVLDCCSSLEVHGFDTDNVFTYLRSEQE